LKEIQDSIKKVSTLEEQLEAAREKRASIKMTGAYSYAAGGDSTKPQTEAAEKNIKFLADKLKTETERRIQMQVNIGAEIVRRTEDLLQNRFEKERKDLQSQIDSLNKFAEMSPQYKDEAEKGTAELNRQIQESRKKELEESIGWADTKKRLNDFEKAKLSEEEKWQQAIREEMDGYTQALATKNHFEDATVAPEPQTIDPEKPFNSSKPLGPDNPFEDFMPYPNIFDPILDISRTSRIIQVAATKDYKDHPVTNSAGQLFNPSIMQDVIINTFNITRREYRNPNAMIDVFNRGVNGVPFWDYGPWRVLVENINPKMGQIQNSFARYWDVTYTLSINPTQYGWKTAVLDQGTVQKNKDDDGTEVIMNEDENTPVTAPVMLDGLGKRLDTTAATWDPVFEWANGSPFEFHQEMDLNLLQLPNPYF